MGEQDDVAGILPTGDESLTDLALKLRLALKYILSRQDYLEQLLTHRPPAKELTDEFARSYRTGPSC